jgi:hypothetical protein
MEGGDLWRLIVLFGILALPSSALILACLS